MASKQNNNDDKDHKQRLRMEHRVANSFLSIMLQTGKQLTLQSKGSSNQQQQQKKAQNNQSDSDRLQQLETSESSSLTIHEKSVFRKQNYYHWSAGIGVSAIMFGTIFGGLRYAAYRRTALATALRPKRSAVTTDGTKQKSSLASKRALYAQMDQPPVATAAAASKQAAAPPMPPLILSQQQAAATATNSSTNTTNTSLYLSEDVMANLQFIAVAAISLGAGAWTSSRLADKEGLYKNVSELPLKPGKSKLCHMACPKILTLHQAYQSKATTATTMTTTTTTEQFTTNDHQQTNANLALIPALLKDPETVELELMVQMVHNCNQRMKYQEFLKQKYNVSDDDYDDELVVEIPEPGVPLHFEPSSTK